MSQNLDGRLYFTFAYSTCYLFETKVGDVSPGVADGSRALTGPESRSIDHHLIAIMQSVRIAQHSPSP